MPARRTVEAFRPEGRHYFVAGPSCLFLADVVGEKGAEKYPMIVLSDDLPGPARDDATRGEPRALAGWFPILHCRRCSPSFWGSGPLP